MRCEASTSLSTMCFGVAPSGLPIDRSMMSSPRRRAAIFNSLVMLKTYGGSRFILENSRIARILAVKLHSTTPGGVNTFTGYGDGYVVVNGERRESSVVVLPHRIEAWAATGFDALTAEDFAFLLELDVEIVILG